MKTRALFFLILTNFLGGSSYLATAYALKGFNEYTLVLMRTVLALLLYLPFAWGRLRTLQLSREDWLRLAAIGIFGYAAPLILGVVGQQLSSGTNASLMIGLEPVCIVVLAAVFLGEKLNWLKTLAVGLGILGLILIVLQGIPFYNATITAHFAGDMILVSHAIGWSLFTILGKPLLSRIDAMTSNTLIALFGLLPMSICSLPSVGGPWISPIPWEAWLAIAYLGFGVSFLGPLTWFYALDLVPASQLANFIFLQPLVGVLCGVLIQGESFSLWSAMGGALVLCGVYAASKES